MLTTVMILLDSSSRESIPPNTSSGMIVTRYQWAFSDIGEQYICWTPSSVDTVWIKLLPFFIASFIPLIQSSASVPLPFITSILRRSK